MKHALKLVILSGIAVFFGVFLSVVFNVTNGGTITITPDLLKDPHRVKLKSLNLSRNLEDSDYYELAVRWLNSFDILTWLAVGDGLTTITGGAAVMVGWWNNNHINSSDSAWIVWWWGNTINNSQDAVIWGGYRNEIAWKKSVVWGGLHNIGNSDGWIILGWDNNYLFSPSIVLWWQWHYASNTNNNLLLGKYTNINNIERSFVWGGEDNPCQPLSNESATLCAPKWILIWTYNGITGVNLVVSGAVKIGWDGLWEWSAWEIKMIDWCFYAHNGSKWYVFGKSSKASGSCNAVTLGKTCKFGKIELQEWDEVSGYSVPYANDCNSVKKSVTCRSDWSLSENVYSYCYKMEGVRWNLYEGWWYECVWDVPSNATLVAWSDWWLTANTTRKLYASVAEAWSNKCAYVCDSSHVYRNGSCVDPQYTCATTLDNKYKCFDGLNYVDGISKSHANNEYMWFCNNWATKCGICDNGSGAEPPHIGACLSDSCADYPLTSCPTGGVCSRCPYDNSKLKLDACVPNNLEMFGDYYDERWVPYRIEGVDAGYCPTGAVCQYAGITIYSRNYNTCVPHRYSKITGCQDCYKKAYMDPLCEYDYNSCS